MRYLVTVTDGNCNVAIPVKLDGPTGSEVQTCALELAKFHRSFPRGAGLWVSEINQLVRIFHEGVYFEGPIVKNDRED